VQLRKKGIFLLTQRVDCSPKRLRAEQEVETEEEDRMEDEDEADSENKRKS
ncbi:hypothetical protein AVEN_236537-1, partial [Araneus ventricosus]